MAPCCWREAEERERAALQSDLPDEIGSGEYDPEVDPSEEDDAEYNCETCPYRQCREDLSDHDHQVLALHRHLNLRVVHDLRLTDLVFELARLQMTSDEADLVLDKLALIHEYLKPEQAERETTQTQRPTRSGRMAASEPPKEIGWSEDD
jgi:hypothetical protein